MRVRSSSRFAASSSSAASAAFSSSLSEFRRSISSGEGLPFPAGLRAARSSSTRVLAARQASSACRNSSKISAAPLRASAARQVSGSARAARTSIMRGSL